MQLRKQPGDAYMHLHELSQTSQEVFKHRKTVAERLEELAAAVDSEI